MGGSLFCNHSKKSLFIKCNVENLTDILQQLLLIIKNNNADHVKNFLNKVVKYYNAYGINFSDITIIEEIILYLLSKMPDNTILFEDMSLILGTIPKTLPEIELFMITRDPLYLKDINPLIRKFIINLNT